MPSSKSAANCRICTFLNRLWRARKGATAIEYALMAAGVSVAIVSVVFGLGDDVLRELYQRIRDTLSGRL